MALETLSLYSVQLVGNGTCVSIFQEEWGPLKVMVMSSIKVGMIMVILTAMVPAALSSLKVVGIGQFITGLF